MKRFKERWIRFKLFLQGKKSYFVEVIGVKEDIDYTFHIVMTLRGYPRLTDLVKNINDEGYAWYIQTIHRIDNIDAIYLDEYLDSKKSSSKPTDSVL